MHFQGGNIFVFIICLKHIFLITTKIGGLHVVQGSYTFQKFIFSSQHLQIVQINYKYFPSNTHNMLVVSY